MSTFLIHVALDVPSPVKGLKLEGRGILVFVVAVVLGEEDGEGGVVDLLLKQVLLVEKVDDAGVNKPLVVHKTLYQCTYGPVLSLECTGGRKYPTTTTFTIGPITVKTIYTSCCRPRVSI